ncbi:MFS general substrate transporter [Lentinus brumalis]|uniref:MFS general substrate transporter n=1 Tax=Lentinus brumalis TaxID=2498619 RepID=A0A371CPG6_9APHY|nr:MFS general substrate transporter [Polyporus brumalis]
MPSSTKSVDSKERKVEEYDAQIGGCVELAGSSQEGPSANLWTKIDVAVLPVVTVLFFLSSLDKGNISNAAVAGLLEELNMTPYQYSVALTVTLVPYTIIEFATNLLMKVVGPRLMLPTLAILWGFTCTMQGFVRSYSGLLACRFFLGMVEGGLLPGISLYLASFYPRRKLQLRTSIMFSAVSIASAFSGLLAAAIVKMDGIGNKPGWAWLFILEGLFTILYGGVAYYLLPNTPLSLPFLTNADKAHIARTLHEEGIMLVDEPGDAFKWAEISRTFRRPHVLLIGLAGFLNGASVSGLGYFLPIILTGLGYEGTQAQLMSVPPFAVAAVLAIIASFFSDRYGQRGFTMVVFGALATAGFAIFLASYVDRVRYGSLFLLVPGCFGIGPPLGTWVANNSAPFPRRATALAFVNSMTNVGAILVTWLFGTLSPAPRYTSATITLLVFQIVTVLCAVGNYVWLSAENKRKETLRNESGLAEAPEKGSEAVIAAGDDSIWYQFVL